MEPMNFLAKKNLKNRVKRHAFVLIEILCALALFTATVPFLSKPMFLSHKKANVALVSIQEKLEEKNIVTSVLEMLLHDPAIIKNLENDSGYKYRNDHQEPIVSIMVERKQELLDSVGFLISMKMIRKPEKTPSCEYLFFIKQANKIERCAEPNNTPS